MRDKSGKILTHITKEHDKPNVFEGSKTPHPKIDNHFKNGENTGGKVDCSYKK